MVSVLCCPCLHIRRGHDNNHLSYKAHVHFPKCRTAVVVLFIVYYGYNKSKVLRRINGAEKEKQQTPLTLYCGWKQQWKPWCTGVNSLIESLTVESLKVGNGVSWSACWAAFKCCSLRCYWGAPVMCYHDKQVKVKAKNWLQTNSKDEAISLLTSDSSSFVPVCIHQAHSFTCAIYIFA